MSKELNELRSQGRKPEATSTTSTDSVLSADMTGHSPSALPADDFDLAIETVEIGGIVIDAETAIEAFRIFASIFHSKLPVLVSLDINAIYQSSPFLFWTIIIIVASRVIVPSLEGLFNQIMGPFQDMRNDPSWLYSGIAVNSALFLGLHRSGSPPPVSRGGYPGTPLERIMTWLGCFYVNGSLSMHLGLPVVLDNSSELARVTTHLQEYPIPRDFAGEIKLQAIVTDFTNVLSNTSNDGTIDSSILHLLDRELDGLRSSYPDQWPRMLEYNTLVAKLHMYGLVISRDRVGNTSRDILLKLSFSTCLRIIHLANMRRDENLPESHGVPALEQQRANPKAYFKGLAFTTAFLLRYFSLNSTASAEEQQLAANHVVLSHTIFTSCSSGPNDELGRVARMFEDLCQYGPMAIEAQQVAPGDRVGVVILVDAMKLASRKRATGTTANIEPPLLPNAQPITPDSSMSPLDAFGIPQSFDPWSMDMIFSEQHWNDPTWDALNLPFMEGQFPPRQTG
ncbi:hypothetical protein NUW58_g2303 [Xylaria curta]|uniref:Uncharacterized protein n=1 Tax=Xylaria curta TaxID=42375 RepID=A0ACC1PJ32_9PEZI|nr:hypothetical protein NUW58_g2303 [Xylaria curta]